MPIKTRRWNDPIEPDDGFRLLVCRYRPRGVRKADETWDAWQPQLGPSRELHAAFYGKDLPSPRPSPRRAGRGGSEGKKAPLSWSEYRRRYLAEMRGRAAELVPAAQRLAAGETVTLLCSSHCIDPARCHRTLLAGLLEYGAHGGRRGPARSSHRLPRPAQGLSGRPRGAARARR